MKTFIHSHPIVFALTFAALVGCNADDAGSLSGDDTDLSASGAYDAEDSVFVPNGYSREDMVEVVPGTFAPADQAEMVLAVKNAWRDELLAGVAHPDIAEIVDAVAPPSVDTATTPYDYVCTGSATRTTPWNSPSCTGRTGDNCSARLDASLSLRVHHGLGGGTLTKTDESRLTGTMTATTPHDATKMKMISVDGEATWGSLYVHPSDYKYGANSVTDVDEDIGKYDDVLGDTTADYVADASGYELEFILNRVVTGGSKTGRQNFSAITVTETCWCE